MVSVVFTSIYYTFWGGLLYALVVSYQARHYATLLPLLLVFGWKIWRYLVRPWPKKRGPLRLDPSEVSPEAGREGRFPMPRPRLGRRLTAPGTDLRRWHLTTKLGRQVWVHGSGQQQSMADRYFLGLDVVSLPLLFLPSRY